MKRLTLTLFIGWLLWFLCAFLIVEFPNADWNHVVAEIVWVLGIGLVFTTVGFIAFLAIRLIARLGMRLVIRTLLIGFVLLILGAFLVIEFPKAGWNRYVTEIVWVLSIALAFATLGFCVFLMIRLVSRLVRQVPPRGTSHEESPTSHSQSKRSRGPIIGFVALFAAVVFIAALLGLIERQIKSSPVYEASVAQARGSAKVLETLGQPVVVGWFVLGELTESSDGSGHATLTIPLKGPKGKGTLRVAAGRRAGDWQLSTLQFVSAAYDSTTDLLVERIK
jgi:MFS family permease